MIEAGTCAACGGVRFAIGRYCSNCKAMMVRQETEKGIATSAAHSEEVDPGWQAKALGFFMRYAEQHDGFLTEDVRAFAYGLGLAVPPAPGAWGAVAREALALDYVRKDGMKPSANPEQHGKHMTYFRSLLR